MLFPIVYLGMGVATVPLVREAYGAPALMTLFLTQIGSDTAQYYTGRTFGRTPLLAGAESEEDARRRHRRPGRRSAGPGRARSPVVAGHSHLAACAARSRCRHRRHPRRSLRVDAQAECRREGLIGR